ncbi:MAG: hypothetical protein ACKOW3_10060 [Hyphomicrobium sp.]
METIYIQIQDVSGNWLTTQTTNTNHDQYIRSLMQTAQKSNPGKRVRAIDGSGRIIDLLG